MKKFYFSAILILLISSGFYLKGQYAQEQTSQELKDYSSEFKSIKEAQEEILNKLQTILENQEEIKQELRKIKIRSSN